MLLLDNHFFFASDFCQRVTELAHHHPESAYRAAWVMYVLSQEAIGNLRGAIAGVDLKGFIGEVYRTFPFPVETTAFKQNPEGHSTRERIEALVATFAPARRVPVMVNPKGESIAIGNYAFNRPQFHDVLLYVWLGGYPHWKDDVRPGYVMEMAAAAESSPHPLFAGAGPFSH